MCLLRFRTCSASSDAVRKATNHVPKTQKMHNTKTPKESDASLDTVVRLQDFRLQNRQVHSGWPGNPCHNVRICSVHYELLTAECVCLLLGLYLLCVWIPDGISLGFCWHEYLEPTAVLGLMQITNACHCKSNIVSTVSPVSLVCQSFVLSFELIASVCRTLYWHPEFSQRDWKKFECAEFRCFWWNRQNLVWTGSKSPSTLLLVCHTSRV